MLRLFILLFFVVNSSAEGSQGQCQEHHCLAVVDAGSTGSRLHIYAYDLDETNGPVKINEIWSRKITPGLSTIEPAEPVINAYLTNLFTNAPEHSMPVYFYATAGMRLHPQPKQQQYYSKIKHWFAAQTQWQLKESQTITGDKEGLLGWLAVNYKVGALSSDGKPLVGVMDMGGASVQLVFPVQNPTNIDSKDLIEVDVYGRHLTLFDHSFLGLGQTLLSQQFLDSPSCYANNYTLPNGSAAQGDADTCQSNVSKLINQVHNASTIAKPAITANPVKSWYAIGGVTSLVGDKLFHFENNQFTNQDLLQQGDSEVCHKQWQDLQTEYSSNEYLYNFCLMSSYYYALMVNGYGLDPKLPINLLPNAQFTDWTLGVVLHQE